MSLPRPTKGRVRSACQFAHDALVKLHTLRVLMENDMLVPESLIAETRFNLHQAVSFFNAGEAMPSNVIELTARQGQEALASIRKLITESCAMPPGALDELTDADCDAFIPDTGRLFSADTLIPTNQIDRPCDTEAADHGDPAA